MKNKKLSKTLFYVSITIMAFSIFMFFMNVLKWDPNSEIGATMIEGDIATPSFFDVMFGLVGSNTIKAWPSAPGMVVLFVFQVILTLASLVIAGLTCTKKMYYEKTQTIFLACVGLSIACGVFSLLSKVFIDPTSAKILEWRSFKTYLDLKDTMKLDYGAIVYGVTMLVAAVMGFSSFVAFKLDK